MRKKPVSREDTLTSKLALKALRDVLDNFSAASSSGLTCSQLRLFLGVALAEGSTVTELAEAADEAVSMASRTLAILGKHGRGTRPGLNWVEERPDPDGDRRVSVIYLTKGGNQVLNRAARILEERGR